MAFKKGHIPWNKDKKIPQLSGENNPNWKGGKPKCKTCGVILVNRYARYCKSHRPVSKKTRKLFSNRMKGNKYGFQKGKAPWNKNKINHWIRGNKNCNFGKFGENHPCWKGGIRLKPNGRWALYLPLHPFANKDGYIYRNRFVIEQILGRYLLPTEVVHHINFDKTDDHPNNLQLFSSNREHLHFHKSLKANR